MPGLSTGAGQWLVALHAHFRGRVAAGPRLRGMFVLGSDAVPALLLLNGPHGNDPRGRGIWGGRGAREKGATGGRRLVALSRGAARSLLVRLQASPDAGGRNGRGCARLASTLRSRASPGRDLVGVPLPLHDSSGRRLSAAARTR